MTKTTTKSYQKNSVLSLKSEKALNTSRKRSTEGCAWSERAHYLGEVADFLDHLLAAKVKPGHVHGAPGVVHQTLARQHALQHQDHRQSLQLPLAHLQGDNQ